MLSQNFTVREFCKSSNALRAGIPNEMNDQEFECAVHLAQHVLEPVRAHFNRPVTINSGYRDVPVNALAGGSSTSQHCSGQAADIEILAHGGPSNVVLFQWIRNHLDFDQLILEYYSPEDPHGGWVHVSYRAKGDNRNQPLVFDGKNYSVPAKNFA